MQVLPRIKEIEHLHYKDIIKVFFIVQPTSCVLLELPEIDENFEQNEHNRIRGDGDDLRSDHWAALNFCIRSKVK